MKTLLISWVVVIIAAAPKPGVIPIKADNAASVVPKALMLAHCARSGFSEKDCKPADFTGAAADLDGNGAPEFALFNSKIDPKLETSCTLYRDEKSKFAEVQRDFPCEIQLLEARTKGWLNIKGKVYPTDCEPLKCEYTWTGTRYKRGSCAPADQEACEAN